MARLPQAAEAAVAVLKLAQVAAEEAEVEDTWLQEEAVVEGAAEEVEEDILTLIEEAVGALTLDVATVEEVG